MAGEGPSWVHGRLRQERPTKTAAHRVSDLQRSVSRRLYQAHDVSQHPGVQKYVLGNLYHLFNLF